jgi:predicted Zn finger-like uncharacterized protein
MNVTCPNCATIYRVDPAKVPEGGVRARCNVCNAVFAVKREGETESSREPAVVQPQRAESPKASAPKVEPPRVIESPKPGSPQPEPRRVTIPSAAPRPAAPVDPAAVPSVSPRPASPQRPVSPVGPQPVASAPAAPATPSAPVSSAPVSSAPALGGRAVPAPPAAPGASRAPAPPAQPSAPAAPAAPKPAAPPRPAPSAPAGGRPINPFLSQDPALKARRLARALISDMVVYHPGKRQEGLRDGNLKELFEEEIKKSWEEYAEQVGRELAESTTYFREALNEILAGGRQIF